MEGAHTEISHCGKDRVRLTTIKVSAELLELGHGCTELDSFMESINSSSFSGVPANLLRIENVTARIGGFEYVKLSVIRSKR
jgi:hypothetical protein